MPRLIFAALVAALSIPGFAFAQSYPSTVVKIVVPFPPGGGADRLGRMIAEKLRVRWNQSVIVENRAGASGNIGSEFVARSAPDGHTLLYGAGQQFVISKMLYKNLTFDPDGFVPVSVLTMAPIMLVANPSLSAQSLQQLIEMAIANPGRLNYSTTGNASSQHLTAELFNSLAGVKTTHIPFSGTAPALTAVLAGQTELMYTEINNAFPHIRAGKLRAIAVGSEKRNSFLPDVPTFSEAVPGLVSTAWGAIAAAPGTPSGIVGLINSGLVEAMRQPDIAKYLNESFIDAVGSTPSDMALLIKQEKARWGAVIKSIGASID